MRRLLKFFLLLLLTGLLYLNFSMYHKPHFEEETGKSYNLDVYRQLQFLKRKLKAGEGERMQRFYPEGYLFIYSLYGLTWTNLIDNLPEDSEIFKEGIEETQRAITAADSKSARAIFNPLLPLRHGAFYAGWSSYLMGKKLSIESAPNREQLYYFKNKCYEIANAFRAAPHPFLESYKNQTWPADNLVCLAALSVHDRIFEPEFSGLIDRTLTRMLEKTDGGLGLIPHIVRAETGDAFSPVRGCSQSLMINFLHEIGHTSAFAKKTGRKHFEIYKKNFLDRRFFLPGVREYPKGISGSGDVDSGPVILDIGGAASIVGQRTFGLYGDYEIYEGLRNCIEAFGVGYTSGEEKKYIFGVLPMADAFIAWANSAEQPEWNNFEKKNWCAGFQGLSAVLIFGIGWLFYRLRKKNIRASS